MFNLEAFEITIIGINTAFITRKNKFTHCTAFVFLDSPP